MGGRVDRGGCLPYDCGRHGRSMMIFRRRKEPRERLPLFRWRGVLGHADRRQRIIVFAMLACNTILAAMTQLGFVVVPVFGSDSYAVLLLVPIALAGMLFGPLVGAVLGMLAGLSISLHAMLQPLDYFEMMVIEARSCFYLFGFTGLFLGLLFALALRRRPEGWRRLLRIALVCLLASSLFSVVFLINGTIQSLIRMFPEPQVDSSAEVGVTALRAMLRLGDPASQALFDAIIMFAASVLVDFLVSRVPLDANDRKLSMTFNGGLFLVVMLGTMVLYAGGYEMLTNQCRDAAYESMVSELRYLDVQLRGLKREREAYTQRARKEGVEAPYSEQLEPQHILDGYEPSMRGYLFIAEGSGETAVVKATNDRQVLPGRTIAETFERELVDDILSSIGDGKLNRIVYDYAAMNGKHDSVQNLSFTTARLGYVLAAESNGYVRIAVMPASAVFADRSAMARWLSTASIVLFGFVFSMVWGLLRKVVTRPVGQVERQLEGICEGELDTVVDAEGSRELVALSAGINTTVGALKEWIAEAERRIDQELETAKAIQESALPTRFPAFPDRSEFDLYASMVAAREVGGDFYDFFLLDDDLLCVLIADVSGKGIPGALFMMEAKAELDNYIQSGMDLADAVRMANERLCEGNDAGMFVTVWVATLNYRTGELTYVNAGHNPPLLRHGGGWTWLTERGGLFLGTFETAKYRSFSLTMEPGDELLLYTDGVNEAFDADGNEYGNDRLEEFLDAHANLAPEPLIGALRTSVADWAEGAVQSDDITMLALEYKG